MQTRNAYYGVNAVCTTHQTFYYSDEPTQTEYQCRRGERNFNQTDEGLRRSGIDKDCAFTTWTQAGADIDNPINLTDKAQ